jgi:hypothetical protein
VKNLAAILPPRLTQAQINALPTGAGRVHPGAVVFNSDLAMLQTNVGTDAAPVWQMLLSSAEINLSGTYAARPAPSAGNVGATYFATDTFGRWLSTGVGWTLIAQGRPLITLTQFGSAPWSTPYDGMEVALVVDGSNDTVWFLRYNGGTASALKWEPIGEQAELYLESNGSVSNGGVINSYANLGATTLVVPRTGDYWVWAFCQVTMGVGSAGTMNFAIYLNTIANVFNFPWAGTLAAGYGIMAAHRKFKAVTLSAGAVVGLSGLSNVANSSFAGMTLGITPHRIS